MRFGVLKNITDLSLEMSKRAVFTSVRKHQQRRRSVAKICGKNLAGAFQEMGTTFIKLGQVLATRMDVIDPEIASELEVLFTGVKPIPFRIVKKIIAKELRIKNIHELFSDIDPVPLGSASLGQCHRAVLKDKSTVVIKVQKPGVGKKVRADLKIMELGIRPLSLMLPQLSIQEIFNDFKDSALKEVDFRLEAENIDRFLKENSSHLTGAPFIFPAYRKGLLSEKMIVLELMRGIPFSQLKPGTRLARKAALRSVEAVLEQIFLNGFFHADPHTGNMFFIEEEGKVGFIDLGLVGHLNEKDKKKFLQVLFAVIKKDKKGLSLALFQLGRPGKNTEFKKFERQIDNLIQNIKGAGVAKVALNEIVFRLLEIARENEIYIPNRYILMIRACVLIEGVAKRLDPSISIFKVAIPIVTKGFLKTLFLAQD